MLESWQNPLLLMHCRSVQVQITLNITLVSKFLFHSRFPWIHWPGYQLTILCYSCLHDPHPRKVLLPLSYIPSYFRHPAVELHTVETSAAQHICWLEWWSSCCFANSKKLYICFVCRSRERMHLPIKDPYFLTGPQRLQWESLRIQCGFCRNAAQTDRGGETPSDLVSGSINQRLIRPTHSFD